MRWYAVLYKGRIVYCDCGVLLCVGMECFILGGVCYCDCGVLLCVGTVYCILWCLCIATMVCCSSSVWFTVYEGLCIVTVVCCSASIWVTVYGGFLCCD